MVVDERERKELAERLKALGSSSRLQILSDCRGSKPVSGIDVQASQGTGRSDRLITREGVRHHLDKLRAADLIEVEAPREGNRREQLYRTKNEALYELAEILAELATSAPGTPTPCRSPPTWTATDHEVPTLTVTHGAQLGRTFPLEEQLSAEHRGWIVGSGERSNLRLAWDPFADEQAAEVTHGSDGYHLVDLRTAGQRVSLNGQALDRGEERPLAHGDVIGVGRTLLLFRDEAER